MVGEPATARREFEARLALSNKAVDETAQLKKTSEAATAELQQERQRTAAMAGELATARREFEARLASLSKAVDETAQLKKTSEAATAELQQQR